MSITMAKRKLNMWIVIPIIVAVILSFGVKILAAPLCEDCGDNHWEKSGCTGAANACESEGECDSDEDCDSKEGGCVSKIDFDNTTWTAAALDDSDKEINTTTYEGGCGADDGCGN